MPETGRIHLTVYGLRNCDTCRKTLKWLNLRKVPVSFHDLRDDGLSASLLAGWLASSFAPYLVNRRSTTWRNLDDDEKQAAMDDPGPVLLKHPTLIKRPVITDGEHILSLGFYPKDLEDYI
jgi:Spx/MgsR family transcriptional regulator